MTLRWDLTIDVSVPRSGRQDMLVAQCDTHSAVLRVSPGRGRTGNAGPEVPRVSASRPGLTVARDGVGRAVASLGPWRYDGRERPMTWPNAPGEGSQGLGRVVSHSGTRGPPPGAWREMGADVRARGRSRTPAVIFDLDGVLVDSEPNYFEAERRLFARYGLDYPAGEAALHRPGHPRDARGVGRGVRVLAPGDGRGYARPGRVRG